ncbi:BCCT family transporter [Vagococcus hydrophili]|uniref:BCCT family transporter n=1 Tax=Vagococcus hydrophili TaxID=2714947 RepID=A0A6G8AT75_9ENTE|nr:BCCT family transporter [Vagococcus hydrophili]QIL48281.1 BCCT family transporter [Vagococcus hydrophili]
MLKKKNYKVYNISLIICVFFTLWGILPERILGKATLGNVTAKSQSFISNEFGWLYTLLMLSFIVICFYLMFSKYGQIKLGKPEDKPQFSYISWLAMLFSAGMGIGLIFWGVSEPIMHLHEPAIASTDTIKNAKNSMNYTFFHWGLQPWSLYAFLGLIIAYQTFRHGRPALISESVTPLFKEKHRSKVADITNIIAIIATVFGVATSLGLGAQQISGGLNYLNKGIPNGFITQLIVIIIVTILFLISATSGLDKGVKILSNANVFFAILLMLVVLLIGPTSFLLDLFIQSTGQYIQNLPSLSFRMAPFDVEAREWINRWTLFYWAWWISWSPYVSSFIARISKGRTIKEFIGGVLIIPTVFAFLWFTVFGGSAIYQELFNQVDIFNVINSEGVEIGLFSLFENYGDFGKILTGLSMLLISSFFITSADSATFVLGMFSSGGELVPSKRIRVTWGLIQSSIAIVLLYAGGLKALQAVSVLASFPFIFIIILMSVNFFRSLSKDDRVTLED